MPNGSDVIWNVLHGLRLKGFADAAHVGVMTGLEETNVVPLLQKLEGHGLISYRDGRFAGWMLTTSGREAELVGLLAQLDADADRQSVLADYQRFLQLNGRLLQVCTDWQLRDSVTLNDHKDSTYDAQVIASLGMVHATVEPILRSLGGILDRFCIYTGRFGLALETIRRGDGDWFTNPSVDSYHTVWFELHEDLLTTLGIERHTEQDG